MELGDLILRVKQVQQMTGLSRATIYNRISPASEYFDPQFPKPFKLGGVRAVGFSKMEVEAWILTQMNERVSL